MLLLRANNEPANHGPLLGWDSLVGQTMQSVPLPGDHNSIMHAPHAQAVAGCIDQRFPTPALPGFST